MTLYIQEQGPRNAETLVFLHGFGVSSWMWTEQVATLSERYHCITLDLPGNGESYQHEWRSLRDTAEQVAAIIRERASGGTAHVVGLSMGGYLALHILAAHPELVKTVVVSGMSTKPFSNVWMWRALVSMMYPLTKFDFMIKATAKALQFPAEIHEVFARDTKRLSQQTYMRVYEELFSFSLAKLLSNAPRPLLAARGELEAAQIRNGLAEFNKLGGQVQTVVAPRVHHGWNGETPALFTEMVAAWIEGRALPSELIQQGGV
jgi:pimeloyl-ACP methyl ester carboxylesterase